MCCMACIPQTTCLTLTPMTHRRDNSQPLHHHMSWLNLYELCYRDHPDIVDPINGTIENTQSNITGFLQRTDNITHHQSHDPVDTLLAVSWKSTCVLHTCESYFESIQLFGQACKKGSLSCLCLPKNVLEGDLFFPTPWYLAKITSLVPTVASKWALEYGNDC